MRSVVPHEPPNYKDCIYCFPPESGLPPL
ncbi:hypothetical protein DZA28_14265 [Pseudomonas alloputida]|uniref:Pyosin/cloacin translocation domain-containing protein n=2 Tax=Pseudomonas TaxID=286 RepID=A0ABD6NFQ5_9PSED|nr:hypothetical protein [Pseudomonas hunanensis]PTV58867.1 hypothetical protein DBL03_17460 [Pseudomonas putida]TRZ63648.1 hypothetical protein DZA28_14265 [Pseudomonas alloputida]HDS1708077.1 S-type pyocin domain-containing protein [Pseudomonas putida]HDS1723323.1 S-type pyocin domain-containing protein [Pseudomonas putida]